jgi:hypothetical protein
MGGRLEEVAAKKKSQLNLCVTTKIDDLAQARSVSNAAADWPYLSADVRNRRLLLGPTR